MSIDLENFNFCRRENSKRFSQYGESERNDKSQKFMPFPRYISAISKSNWPTKMAFNPPPPEIFAVKRLELYGLKTYNCTANIGLAAVDQNLIYSYIVCDPMHHFPRRLVVALSTHNTRNVTVCVQLYNRSLRNCGNCLEWYSQICLLLAKKQ